MWGKLRRHSNGFSAVRLYFPFVPFILADFPFYFFFLVSILRRFRSFSIHFLSCSPFPSCLASSLPFSLNFHFTFLSLLLFLHFPSFPLIFLSLPFQFPFAFDVPLISCYFTPVYPRFFPLFVFPFHFPFAFLSLLLIFPSCLFHILRFSFRFPFMALLLLSFPLFSFHHFNFTHVPSISIQALSFHFSFREWWSNPTMQIKKRSQVFGGAWGHSNCYKSSNPFSLCYDCMVFKTVQPK